MKKIKRFIKRCAWKVVSVGIKCYTKLANLFMNKNQVLFISFDGNQYSDNPRAVSEELHRLRPKTKIVWLFKNPKAMKPLLPKYVKAKKYTKFNRMRYLANSIVWVDNDTLVYKKYVAKNKNQLFIETWHGDRGPKKCFYNVKNFKPAIRFSTEYDGYCDYFCVGSEFAEKIVPSMFKYKGEILKCGYPRNDILFSNDEAKKNEIKKELGIAEDSNVLMYAPTFRKNKSKNADNIDFEKIIGILQQKTNKKWTIITRMHHLMRKEIEISENLTVVDGTHYYDMANLLFVSDVLISDYSSCTGDFILKDKPVYLFISDYDSYKNKDRGLHYDIEETPFMFAKTNEELINLIKDYSEENSKKNCRALKDFYGVYEKGDATKVVCDLILKKLK